MPGDGNGALHPFAIGQGEHAVAAFSLTSANNDVGIFPVEALDSLSIAEGLCHASGGLRRLEDVRGFLQSLAVGLGIGDISGRVSIGGWASLGVTTGREGFRGRSKGCFLGLLPSVEKIPRGVMDGGEVVLQTKGELSIDRSSKLGKSRLRGVASTDEIHLKKVGDEFAFFRVNEDSERGVYLHRGGVCSPFDYMCTGNHGFADSATRLILIDLNCQVVSWLQGQGLC